jgi:hypothetical protein
MRQLPHKLRLCFGLKGSRSNIARHTGCLNSSCSRWNRCHGELSPARATASRNPRQARHCRWPETRNSWDPRSRSRPTCLSPQPWANGNVARRQWHHGRHHGRQGWWWAVGNGWTTPAYPYPVYLSTAYDENKPSRVRGTATIRRAITPNSSPATALGARSRLRRPEVALAPRPGRIWCGTHCLEPSPRWRSRGPLSAHLLVAARSGEVC